MAFALRRLTLGLALAASLSAASAQTPVNVGITDSSSDAVFFIADKKGYFKAEGLAATMTSFASAAKMIAPLGTGQLDVGGGTVAAGLYNAVERGINIKIVADKARSRTATSTRPCWCARISPTAAATSRSPTSRG